MITYSGVLRFYKPKENGDFFMRYEINGRSFVIFSPERKIISCVELYNFRDISPIELATIIGSELTKDKYEEFQLDNVCSKESLVSYLFDIREDSSYIVTGHVSNMNGFILYDIFNPSKARNVFLYSTETGDNELLFENDLCFAELNSQQNTGNVNICWNPFLFKDLADGVGEGGTSFLLPSDRNIMFTYITRKNIDSNISYNLFIDNDSVRALMFIMFFLTNQQNNPNISIEFDNKMVILHLSSWSSTKVMNFVSKIQRRCSTEMKRYYEIEDSMSGNYFQCKLVDSDSFVIFPNIEICCNALCKEIISCFSINNIHLIQKRDGQAIEI